MISMGLILNDETITFVVYDKKFQSQDIKVTKKHPALPEPEPPLDNDTDVTTLFIKF